MQELQVPTKNVRVEIHLSRGETLDGLLYFTEDVYHHAPLDLLLEVLNDERVFLPFDVTSPCKGRAILNKTHIVSVVPDLSGLDDWIELDPADAEEPCKLRLSDGETLDGTVRVATPVSQSRITDKLNHADSFFPVVTDDGIILVHRQNVVQAS